MTAYAVRFSKKQRIEHLVVMTTFILLALTGFPQKFYEAGFSRFLICMLILIAYFSTYVSKPSRFSLLMSISFFFFTA